MGHLGGRLPTRRLSAPLHIESLWAPLSTWRASCTHVLHVPTLQRGCQQGTPAPSAERRGNKGGGAAGEEEEEEEEAEETGAEVDE